MNIFRHFFVQTFLHLLYGWLSWICLNMPEYVGLCLNIPESTWMAFCLHLGKYNPWSTWTRDQRLHKTRRNMKEHEAFSLKRKNVISIISIIAGSIWFFFVKDRIFWQVRFQIFSYLWGPRRLMPVNLDISETITEWINHKIYFTLL